MSAFSQLAALGAQSRTPDAASAAWCLGLGTLGLQPSFRSHTQMAAWHRDTLNSCAIAAHSRPRVQWTAPPLAVSPAASHDSTAAFWPTSNLEGLGLFGLGRRPSTPSSLYAVAHRQTVEASPRGVGPQAPETERGAYGPPVREIAGQYVTSVNGQQVIVGGGACGM